MSTEIDQRPRRTALTPLYPEGQSYPHAPIIDGVRRRPSGETLVLSTTSPYRREVSALHASFRMKELPDDYQEPLQDPSLVRRIGERVYRQVTMRAAALAE